jgi:murein DD-endopeptidase MepM/ murein hydrolase activator NlpD
LGEWRTHNGVDIKAERGTEVIAAAEGTVADASRDERWGAVVVLDHPDGKQTTYAGLAWPLPVKAGDVVTARQVIGKIEGVPIESADGIHLHFELRVDGVRADPLSLIATRE